MHSHHAARGQQPAPAHQTTPLRWECRCASPGILLATIDGHSVNIKARDRYYYLQTVYGALQATCPRCGRQLTYQFGPPPTA
jgi:hypothetical protein